MGPWSILSLILVSPIIENLKCMSFSMLLNVSKFADKLLILQFNAENELFPSMQCTISVLS
jgi:hypothetical protein